MSAKRRIARLLRWSVSAIVVVVVGLLVLLEVQLVVGRRRVEAELAQQGEIARMAPFGSVHRLSMLPLIDYYADRSSLATEPGLSYLIRADDQAILLDTGLNRSAEHPSPLLRNMHALGVDPARIDALFISHVHIDHIGDMRRLTVSPGAGVTLRAIPAYVPSPVELASWNPQPRVQVVRGPKVLANGIASTGPIPRQLFLLGHTDEQALAVNLEGKGIVLFIGCGHQGAWRIVERAKALFDAPVYAVVGGLHMPYGRGRAFVGPLDMQRIVGSDRFPLPWREHGVVLETIDALRSLSPRIVALSAHDSSDAAIAEVKAAFGDRFRDVRVGREMVF